MINSGQDCRPCRGSCSLIPGRGYFGDLPGDEIVVSPPSPIVEPLTTVLDSSKAGEGKVFPRNARSLVCESPVPEPIDGVCAILYGPNVETLVSCRPGVESDTKPAINLEYIIYGPHQGWISFGFSKSAL